MFSVACNELIQCRFKQQMPTNDSLEIMYIWDPLNMLVKNSAFIKWIFLVFILLLIGEMIANCLTSFHNGTFD